jgi:NAD(P)-dependent dehydrogenase (short-subunit alcohol dehydrogenase family)
VPSVTDTERPAALITMAGGYVGPTLARRLASSGFDLLLHLHGAGDLLGDGEAALDLDNLRELGGRVETLEGVDLTTAAGNQAVVNAALGHFGRLDAACFVTGSIVTGRFLDTPEEQWHRIKQVNLDMVFHALQAVLPPMVEAGHGQVVVFTSAAGARPEPKVSIYSATRAGANALVRAVGLEMAATGVTVNAIGTNFMDFPGFLAATGANDPARRARIEQQVPMRRLGTMDELAEFTAVLLDGRTRFQTGQFFSFSGGWST